MVDTHNKTFLELCLSKRLVDKKVAGEVYQRARREGLSAAEVLVNMGVLAQHTVDALKREMDQAQVPMDIDGFRIIRKLGQGGMGAVYLAEQISLHRQVALKVIAPQIAADAQAVDRFMREARTAAAINHPNIISVIDVGYDNGHLYMALELVSGGDAAQLATRFNGVLPEMRALEIISDCCRGLGALYEARLIHRDIKPANIFITREGVAKLADLGLARSEQGGDRLTMSGHTIGTPAFMSPEQASGKSDLDSRSDIYSLGASLFALTTGSPPFTGDGIFAIAAKLLTEPAPDARSLNPTLSPETARVIARCLAKQPAERFQTPHDLSVALTEALSVVGTSAGLRPATPPVTRTLSENPVRSHPTPATVAPRKVRPIAQKRSSRPTSWPIVSGIVVVLAVAAVVGITWSSRAPELRRPGPTPSIPVASAPAADPTTPTSSPSVSPRPQAIAPAPQETAPVPTAVSVAIPVAIPVVTSAVVATATEPAIKGLIAYWPLDEGAGRQVGDLSGNKSNGTISNATWTSGKMGGALAFSQPSKLNCGNAQILTRINGITVMCWIKTTMVVPKNYLASVLRHDGYFTALQISPDGTAHSSSWGHGNMNMAVFPWRGVWDDGLWHHYAVTFDEQDGVRIYKDGKPFAHRPDVAGPLPSECKAPFMMGASEANNEYFEGSLDEVRVYDHPLTPAEIQVLATIPSTRASPSVSGGLLAYWPFDEGSGKKAQDRSISAVDGLITGAAWGPGVAGTSLIFTPPSKVLFGDPKALAPKTISVTCWIKTTVRARGLEPISVIRHDGHFTALQLMPDGTAQAAMWPHGHVDRMTFAWDGEWNDDRWHHYAVTYHQEQGGQIFKDGKILAAFPRLTGALQPPNAPFVIGGSEIDGESFTGSLDEVRVYDRVLSAGEVNLLASIPLK